MTIDDKKEMLVDIMKFFTSIMESSINKRKHMGDFGMENIRHLNPKYIYSSTCNLSSVQDHGVFVIKQIPADIITDGRYYKPYITRQCEVRLSPSMDIELKNWEIIKKYKQNACELCDSLVSVPWPTKNFTERHKYIHDVSKQRIIDAINISLKNPHSGGKEPIILPNDILGHIVSFL